MAVFHVNARSTERQIVDMGAELSIEEISKSVRDAFPDREDYAKAVYERHIDSGLILGMGKVRFMHAIIVDETLNLDQAHTRKLRELVGKVFEKDPEVKEENKASLPPRRARVKALRDRLKRVKRDIKFIDETQRRQDRYELQEKRQRRLPQVPSSPSTSQHQHYMRRTARAH